MEVIREAEKGIDGLPRHLTIRMDDQELKALLVCGYILGNVSDDNLCKFIKDEFSSDNIMGEGDTILVSEFAIKIIEPFAYMCNEIGNDDELTDAETADSLFDEFVKMNEVKKRKNER